MRSKTLICLVTAVLLAGCLTEAPGDPGDPDRREDPEDPSPENRSRVEPGAWTLACTPGSGPLPSQPCAERPFGNARMAEPMLAAHPTEEGIFVLGAMTFPESIQFFRTVDGGVTWDPIGPDWDADEATTFIDPVVHFTQTGLLFVAGMMNDLEERRIVYAISDDMGSTWSASGSFQGIGGPSMGLDRPWIDSSGNHTVLSWADIGAGSQWASFAADGSLLESRTIQGCTDGSAAFGETWILTCLEESSDGLRVYRLEPASGAQIEIASPSLQGLRTPVLRSTSHGFALFDMRRSTDDTGLMSRTEVALWLSPDARQWRPVDLGISAERSRIMWLEDDPNHWSHLLIRTSDQCLPQVFGNEHTCGSHQVLHLALHGPTGSTSQTTTLSSSLPRHESYLGDHYHGIAFGEGQGLIAWADEAGLAITPLEPPGAGETADR